MDRTTRTTADLSATALVRVDGAGSWTPGRVALAGTRLSCIASRRGPAEASFVLEADALSSVTVGGRPWRRVLEVTTTDRRIELRLAGAAALAHRLSTARTGRRRAIICP